MPSHFCLTSALCLGDTQKGFTGKAQVLSSQPKLFHTVDPGIHTGPASPSQQPPSCSPVPSHIQDVELGGVGQLRGQQGQAIVPQGQDIEVGTASDLCWQRRQSVPVHVQVRQLGQLPQGLGQGLQGAESVVARGKNSTGKRHKALGLGNELPSVPTDASGITFFGTSLGQVFPQAHRLIHANSSPHRSTAHSNHQWSRLSFRLSAHSQSLCFTNQITSSLEQGHFQSQYPKPLTDAAWDEVLHLSGGMPFGMGNPSTPAIPENVLGKKHQGEKAASKHL